MRDAAARRVTAGGARRFGRSRNCTSATRSSVVQCSSDSPRRYASSAAPWTPRDRVPSFVTLVTKRTTGARMTGAPPGGGGPSGFLEFFILEAGEYVEQLDRLIL